MNRVGLSSDARGIESYTGEIKAELREKKAQKVVSLGGLRLYECPRSYITDDSFDIIRVVFLTDQTGALLFSGGIGEQPAWLVEALEIYRVEKILQTRRSESQKS